MTDFNSVSRNKFLVRAGLWAGAVLLKGCMENPPEAGGGNLKMQQQQNQWRILILNKRHKRSSVSWMDMMFK